MNNFDKVRKIIRPNTQLSLQADVERLVSHSVFDAILDIVRGGDGILILRYHIQRCVE